MSVAFGAFRAAAAGSAAHVAAECRTRRSTCASSGAARKNQCPGGSKPSGMGAARRPGRLGVAGSRDDLLVTRALRDDAAIEKGVSSLKQLGLDDIGVNIDELSRDIGITDSNDTMSLNREFAVYGFVRVTDGRSGLPKVTLTHPCGSHCDVYLLGANIMSWVLANGGEVFYTPDGVAFPAGEPLAWGNPVCFPQFGAGGEFAGTPPSDVPLPVDGFAKSLEWNIVQTGVHENKRGEAPYVSLEIADTEATRAIWNHNFHVLMEISLDHAGINVSMQVKNTGETKALEYAAALRSHVAVADAKEPSTNYVGLEDCVYLDNTLHPTKPRVRFTDQEENQEWLHLDAPTDRVYLNTQNDTGVEVGTGCTVFARNMCAAGVDGFGDRAVFNPWMEADAENYRWYTGLAIGAIGKLIKVEPGLSHASKMRFEVLDVIKTQTLQARKLMYQKHALRKMADRPVYDIPGDELPTDFQ